MDSFLSALLSACKILKANVNELLLMFEENWGSKKLCLLL